MKVAALLIIWSLPLLQTGGQGDSLGPGRTGRSHAEAHATSPVIHNARNLFFPDDPSSGSIGASLGEEEDDSLEDGYVDAGSLLCWPSPDLGRGNPAFLAPLSHDFLRIPCLAHPLRC